MIGWEWSDLLPPVEDSIRSGEFEEMSDYTDFYVGLFTRMHQAEKAQADFKEMIEFEKMCELEALQEAWDDLQSVPSYVEQQARTFADEIEKEV